MESYYAFQIQRANLIYINCLNLNNFTFSIVTKLTPMYAFLKNILFLLPAETAHYFSLTCLKLFLRLPFAKQITTSFFTIKHSTLERTVFGLHFKNPVGLAAGFDKNAAYIDELACLGFGFIEIGTVTPLAQSGNDKPRLFRLLKDKAIINRMGFNNEGVDAVVESLKKRKSDIIVGGNIGKNKITSNEEAVNDYIICFNKLFDYVDYFVVNVSSPNTPGLRELQEKDKLAAILQSLQDLNNTKPKPKPILLKIAPDLNTAELDDIIAIVNETKIAGLIATNTTLSRENLRTNQQEIAIIGNGGLSGEPIKAKANEVLDYIMTKSQKRVDTIGVGGIMNANDAKEKLDKGAVLIQVYSGFIYNGPSLIKKINRFLVKN